MSLLAQHEQKQNHFFSRFLAAAVIAVLLALGLFFRFVNLDKKIYLLDEMLTSFRISGYSAKELSEDLLGGREITVQDIQKYQRINPERSLLHTIGSLAIEDPKQPPLYFILARVWAELFGDSIRAIRSLSAFISLFVIPSLYWLCRELFESRRIASLAIALMSVSLFHVLYAQEARPYSLLILTTVLSSAALLRAMRLTTGRSWAFYTLTLFAGIYAHTLFAVVLVAHGIYAAILKKVALEKFFPYLVASLAAVAAFLPWSLLMLFGLLRLQDVTGWITATEAVHLDRLNRWTVVFSSVSIDTAGALVLNTKYGLDNSWIRLIRLPVLVLIGYSLYFLYHKSSTRIWLFVFTLSGTSVIGLIFSDLTLGWQTSGHPQFLSSYYLAILLSVAYLLATQIVSPKVSKRRVWQTITVILIASGVASCALRSRAATWWNKDAAYGSPQVARLINQSTHPLLIATSDSRSIINVFLLSNVLDPRVRILLIADSNELKIRDDFTDVFLLNPNERLRQRLERGDYRIEATHVSELWRLAKKP
jgi:uncharacterized membrane protein